MVNLLSSWTLVGLLAISSLSADHRSANTGVGGSGRYPMNDGNLAPFWFTGSGKRLASALKLSLPHAKKSLYRSQHFSPLADLAKRGINWNGNNWAMSCDFNGNDLSHVQISSERCGEKCAETSRCTHFTWTQFNRGTCWMKQGSVSKDNAFTTNDPTMVCGVMNIGPNPSQAGGTTTRYWDCCKPSCSWPNKVSGANTYVKSCRKDGYSFFDNPNAVSGCDGGEAFTCNNQKPWAISDQLAYGFAAATIPGLSEEQRCCACYKLDFTSGPVQGKTMIVQVTNSGSDVHPNQFDLQIPGGGVGIFNGCSSQWNSPPNGWGQRHGGVSSRQECDALPESIRAGCQFRFDWFKGADNPTMTYSRVSCPAALVDITGCSRNN